jgi:N6-L-threonylcarbamoyladenine synthase
MMKPTDSPSLLAPRSSVRLLTLETTCDETAAAVITGELQVLSSVVASQDKLHERFGGVVPEIASRAHVERILPVIDEALRKANVKLADLDAIAVANTPGLAGSLLIGLTAAKALCVACDLPLLAVNHLQAHIYACRLASGVDVFPCIGLIVSGGHSNLYRCDGPTDFTPLGGTIDDAAGEAFDKVASLLGLPYPGGPSIERTARTGNPRAYRFPRPLLDDTSHLNFSFSGLKTAVRYTVEKQRAGGREQGRNTRDELPNNSLPTADIAASFQEAVIDCLVGKAELALTKSGYQTLCVGGGVAANSRFRQRLEVSAKEHGYTLHVPPLSLCTDNAVMGAIAIERFREGLFEDLSLDIHPGPERAAMNANDQATMTNDQ